MNNKYITVAYKLYADMGNGRELVEEATKEHPFQFISGLGFTLDSFENNICALAKGNEFDFTLSVDEAYGPHQPELVHELPRKAFEIDGKFDAERICVGAVVPLMNEEGQRFPGTITDVTDNTVTVDLNNPLAGKELQFVGTVTENREATNAEIQELIQAFSAEGCGGGGCSGGGCGGGGCESGGGCGKGGCCGGC